LASLGMDRERFIVPEDFNAPLPEEILAAFEGGEE
ncbi:MAG: type II toxin-antitoxin system prevent-host-death family antitoxin, partial [Tolypothrix sp. Co-bin9]|nr:type II toxin-antitoxin system prevent-host-death family antitoxin [Tolypothrix sp. Co-bin9]